MNRRAGRFGRPWMLVAGLALLLPTVASAQEPPDFLFRRPLITLGVRAGYAMPRAASDVFGDARDLLTIGDRDFDGASWGGELAVRVAARADLVLGVGYSKSEVWSEFRDWVDTDDLPIEQNTRFSRRPMTLSLKAYLFERGRSVGSFAWVPTRWVPYAGAGAGWVWYEWVQEGSFVDFETLDIFSTRFESSGTTPTAHAFAGIDLSVGPRFVVSGEARYSWASTEMGSAFVGFDEIDLAGFQATLGVSVRF